MHLPLQAVAAANRPLLGTKQESVRSWGEHQRQLPFNSDSTFKENGLPRKHMDSSIDHTSDEIHG